MWRTNRSTISCCSAPRDISCGPTDAPSACAISVADQPSDVLISVTRHIIDWPRVASHQNQMASAPSDSKHSWPTANRRDWRPRCLAHETLLYRQKTHNRRSDAPTRRRKISTVKSHPQGLNIIKKWVAALHLWLTNIPTNRLTDESSSASPHYIYDWPTNQLTDQMTYYQVGHGITSMTDQRTDWLTHHQLFHDTNLLLSSNIDSSSLRTNALARRTTNDQQTNSSLTTNRQY